MGEGVGGWGCQIRPQKNNRYSLMFGLMLYIKFQTPDSSGILVLTQIKSTEKCKRELQRQGLQLKITPVKISRA